MAHPSVVVEMQGIGGVKRASFQHSKLHWDNLLEIVSSTVPLWKIESLEGKTQTKTLRPLEVLSLKKLLSDSKRPLMKPVNVSTQL